MESSKLYSGHSIFRNQPSYKEFNKPVESDEILFAFLNDVNPEILKQEQEAPSQTFTSYRNSFQREDPRNKKIVKCTIYDHSTNKLFYTFPLAAFRSSLLSRPQQAACLRVLLAWQNNTPVGEDDFLTWRLTDEKRLKEHQEVQKDLYECKKGQLEHIYEPMKSLVDQYSKWYKLRVEQMLRRFPNSTYTTYSGLPQLSQCKALNVNTASIEDVKLLCREGQVRLWPDVKMKQEELSSLRICLERYVCADILSNHGFPIIANGLKDLLDEVNEDIYILPLDALLMLFTNGSYIDLPTEVPVLVRDIPDTDYRSIEFKEPFPARNCAWHTNSQMVTQAYASFALTQWLQFTAEGTVQIEQRLPKIDAERGVYQGEYKLKLIDENPQLVPQYPKSNSALVSWMLRTEHQDGDSLEPGLQICSTLPVAAVKDTDGKQPIGCHLIKLESKPDCGCEIMTSYELISCWLQLKLQQTTEGHCSRISLREFTPLLEEKLTLDKIETQLLEQYQINMGHRLCQLHEFLKMLRCVAPGEYLLRSSDKYKDKFLLCRPTQEPATTQSFTLEGLVKEAAPNDVNFRTQGNNYLPISTTLCSRLHEEFQLLPCAFVAKGKGAKRIRSKPITEQTPVLVQRKRAIYDRKTKRTRKRSSQKQRKKAAAEKAKEEDREIEKIMCL